MKTLYVRVQRKKGTARFFRCGIEFNQAWLLVEVDAATAARLEAEQMLEVSETRPAELDDAPAGDSAVIVQAVGGQSDTPAAAPVTLVAEAPADPTLQADPAARLAAIRAAIDQLDTSDPALWTAQNKPKTEALAALTGWPVSAVERDAVLAQPIAEGGQ